MPAAGDQASASAPDDELPVLQRLARDVTISQGAREGAAWIAGSRVAGQAFQFAVSILTARLLLPSQFGNAAVALSIAAFAQLFTDLGLAQSVIHARRVTQELLNTAFWLNATTGLGLTAALIGLSEPVAAFFDKPQLAGPIVLASFNFVLASSAVQIALLERTFNFRRLAIMETAATVLGVGAVPVAALLGSGTASLVLGPLVTSLTLNTALWVVVRWRPTGRPTRPAVAQLWEFSRGVVGFNLVSYWARNLDNLALGATASATSLGEYTRAYTLTGMPVNQMSLVVGRVLFPALTRMRDEPRRVGRAWGRGMSAAAAVTMPAVVALATMGPALVAVLYGPRWAGMVPVLELLALSCVPQIVGSATGSLFRAVGATGTLFRRGLISSGLSVVAILVGLPWGTVGVAAALFVRAWLSLWITLWPLRKLLDLPLRELLRPAITVGWPVAGLAAGSLLVRWLVPESLSAPVVLLLQLAAGGGLYLLAMWRTDAPALRMVLQRLRPSQRHVASRTG